MSAASARVVPLVATAIGLGSSFGLGSVIGARPLSTVPSDVQVGVGPEQLAVHFEADTVPVTLSHHATAGLPEPSTVVAVNTALLPEPGEVGPALKIALLDRLLRPSDAVTSMVYAPGWSGTNDGSTSVGEPIDVVEAGGACVIAHTYESGSERPHPVG